MTTINWWRVDLPLATAEASYNAILSRKLSMGSITAQLEEELSDLLNVKHVICTNNGSSAILLAMLAMDLSPEDEVIIPNRTWVASAHAAGLLGCKIKFVDVCRERPVMSIKAFANALTNKTRLVLPAQICGCAVEMEEIWRLQAKYGFNVIEDSAQALFGRYQDNFIGTQSDVGSFSFAVSKLLTSGQGGFAATNRSDLAKKMRSLRTHGVDDVNNASPFTALGQNSRYPDVLAAMILAQLPSLNEKIDKINRVYEKYKNEIEISDSIELLPINIEAGEIPLYVEILCDDRATLIKFLQSHDVETRQIYPNLETAKYLGASGSFPNSDRFQSRGLVLPCGPDQTESDLSKVIGLVNSFFSQRKKHIAFQ